jgi:hypothetical protein
MAKFFSTSILITFTMIMEQQTNRGYHLLELLSFENGMADLRNGGMAEWRNGGMEEWRNGGMAE